MFWYFLAERSQNYFLSYSCFDKGARSNISLILHGMEDKSGLLFLGQASLILPKMVTEDFVDWNWWQLGGEETFTSFYPAKSNSQKKTFTWFNLNFWSLLL